MRTRRFILVIGAAATALLLAAAGWVAGTEAGLRFLVARAGALAPGTLEIDAVEGRLVGPLQLTDVLWEMDGQRVTARRIQLDWQPLALLRREVRLDRLHLQGIAVDLPAPAGDDSATAAPGAEWQDFTLPWRIVIADLQLDDARLRRDGMLLAEITTLRGALDASDSALSLEGLELSSPQGSASGHFTASLDPRAAWDAALTWDINLPDLAAAGVTRFSGLLHDLELRQEFTAPAAAVVSGRVRGLPQAPSWDLRLELQPLPAGSALWPQLLDGAAINADISGALEQMRIQGDFSWPAVLAAPAAVDAELGWRDAVLVLDSVKIRTAQAAALDVQGTFTPGPAPEIELRGQASAFTWPLSGGETLVTLPLLEFEGGSKGTDWRLAARGEVVPSNAPAGQVDVRVRGDASSLRVEALQVNTLGGTVTGTGSAAWQDAPRADFLLQVAGLDPSLLAPAWPGRIGGALHLHGSLGSGQQFHVEASDITGELRSVPLAAAFRLSLGADTVDITEANLSLGSASVTASGLIDRDRVAMSARLDAPRLEELGPEFTGRISASAQITGPRATPVLEMRADGGRLSWGSLRARVLQADASVDLSGESLSSLQAQLTGISARTGRNASMRLEASGRPQDHTVRLEFTRQRPEQSLSLALHGELEGTQWRGQLSDVTLIEAQQALWRLQAPADLAASSDSLQLGRTCMDGVLGLLCLEAKRLATGRWLGDAELARLDLGPLSEWLGLGLTARGELTGATRLVAGDERFLELDGGFRLSQGDIRRRDRRDETLLSWAAGQLDLSGDAKAAEARLRLELPDSNLLQGRLRIGWNENDPSLDGTLQAQLDRLALVTELVPELSALGGELDIRLGLAGTLAAPEPSGSFVWRDGNAAIPELGLAPEDIQLRADIAQGRLTFRTTGKSGEGGFEASGEFDLRGAGVSGRASLQGENLTVANLPDITVVANPELRFGFRENRLNIGGRVHIPYALISGVGTSGAVRASPDEVIIGPRAPEGAESGVVVSSRIEVSAGPAVQLQIGGFSGRVEGSVLTVIQPEADPWGRGELRVVNGEMTVLGQTLEIETGRLIYDGGPLENPGLEIRAVRRVQDVTAGALVRGTAENPQVSVFSEPPMSNAEALSYLTLGKSLEQIQSGERQTVNQAANALALSGGGLVFQDLARRLGFQDLEVSAETGDNGSALVVSKYLGGGLYVSYGLGLFDTVNTVRLRYQFNRRLSLEAESGEESSADLFYSFERN